MGPMKSPHRDVISNSADAVHNILVKGNLSQGTVRIPLGPTSNDLHELALSNNVG